MLPQSKTKPKASLHNLTALVYGPSKIGKSTWCSHAENALFLATEPGLNSLEVFEAPITCWDDLLQACAEIAEGKHDFKTIIIDTVDNAYRMCADYVCKKFQIEHESDLGFGKGYALINNEFQRVINKLAFLPYGLILISHSQEREIETRTGKHTRIMPTLPDKARKLLTGLVDLILFCDLETKVGENSKPIHQRVMRTKPSPNYDAGDRTGMLPEVIPLDFPSFMEAFAATSAPKPTVKETAKSKEK
ncbi:ATP-binding protein [Pontiellaceae bacterium B12219]|nr:ATP-binding protein [Pontiellaceae bacterium B12219]